VKNITVASARVANDSFLLDVNYLVQHISILQKTHFNHRVRVAHLSFSTRNHTCSHRRANVCDCALNDRRRSASSHKRFPHNFFVATHSRGEEESEGSSQDGAQEPRLHRQDEDADQEASERVACEAEAKAATVERASPHGDGRWWRRFILHVLAVVVFFNRSMCAVCVCVMVRARLLRILCASIHNRRMLRRTRAC
jgi:hypothetical protein